MTTRQQKLTEAIKAARPLLERVARMGDRIGQHTVGEIMAISDRAAAWLRDNPPPQPVPPADGEVAELVVGLPENQIPSFAVCRKLQAHYQAELARLELLAPVQPVPVILHESPPSHLLPSGCDLDEWGVVVRETWKAARREVERQQQLALPMPSQAEAGS